MSDPDLDVSEEEAAALAKFLYGVLPQTSTPPQRERQEEPSDEHPILEPTHPPIEDDLADEVEGAQYADIYKSRSTYVFKPTPPRTPIPTRTRKRYRPQEDIAPEDQTKISDSDKQGGIYESQSTQDIGELGSVIVEKARRLREKSVQTIREKTTVKHKPTSEIDAVDAPTRESAKQTAELYKSRSTYEMGKPVAGAGEYLTGVALSGGVSFIRGAASVVDPREWVRGAHDITYLASSKKAQRELAETVGKDPLSFAVDVGAGFAGGYLVGRGISRRWREWELGKFYEEFPEEAFYAEDGIPDPSIPQPVDVERLGVVGKESVRVVDDLGAGFLESHQVKVGTLPSKGTATKTLDLRMGKAAKSGWEKFAKGYYRTGHDLIPGLIPEEMGILETHYRFGLEYGTTHLPGLRGLPPYFDAALGMTPLTGVLPGAGAALLSGVPDIDQPLGDPKTELKITQKTVEDTLQDQKPRTIGMADYDFKPKTEPQLPGFIPPGNVPKVDQPTLPGFEPYPPPEITKQTQDDILTPGLTYKQMTKKMKDFMTSIPGMPQYPGLKRPPQPAKIRLPRIPKKETSTMKLPGLGKGFGLTRRSAMTPEELVTGRKPRKKKKRKKK